MILTWIGHSCFKIQDKNGPGGIVLVTDPYDKSVGLKVQKFEEDIVTVSHDHKDHNNVKSLRGNPFIIENAGEYDIKGVSIHGVESYHDTAHGKDRGNNIIFRIEIDNISVSHLGDLGHTLDNKQLEVLSGTDILLIPVGGKYTLDAKAAVEVVSQVEPRIIIPMHYKIPGNTLDIAGVDKFIKEISIKPTEEKKLKISKKDLPQDDMELVVMSV
ncbi:MBL fold metallo-hydrolase [bacterium]|nr:MBL fold metallo-hydrolase [bacterium]